MIPIATPKLYFENPVGRVLEHPDGYVIFQYHPGKRKFSELQALLTHTRNLLVRNRWHRLLGDQRLMAPFTDEESAWIVDYWLDSSRQGPHGLYGAVLLANDVFARLSNDQVMHEAKTAALTYRVFDREETAVAWLRQQAQRPRQRSSGLSQCMACPSSSNKRMSQGRAGSVLQATQFLALGVGAVQLRQGRREVVLVAPAAWAPLPDPYRLQEAQAGVITFRFFNDEEAALAQLA